jgi:hypothetical protein
MMYHISTLSADQSIEIRLSQNIYQILAVQGFEVLVSGSQGSGRTAKILKYKAIFFEKHIFVH